MGAQSKYDEANDKAIVNGKFEAVRGKRERGKEREGFRGRGKTGRKKREKQGGNGVLG